MNVTNKYLKSSMKEINNFYRNHTEPPEDMLMNLILELKVSHLIMPTVFDGENLIFPHIEVDNGTNLLPLFTSEEELEKYSKDFIPFGNEIAYYIEVVNDIGLDGIIIDLKTDELCIDDVLLNRVPTLLREPEGKGLDAESLREIALNASNPELKRFIADESNFNNYDELSRLLVKSVLVNSVVGEDDFNPHAQNGIIDMRRSGTFTIYTKMEGRQHYGVVFTDTDALKEFHKTLDYPYYAQATNKFMVFNFILTNSLDGMIINPGTDDYYVPRQVLLHLFDDDLADPDFEDAASYAFIID